MHACTTAGLPGGPTASPCVAALGAALAGFGEPGPYAERSATMYIIVLVYTIAGKSLAPHLARDLGLQLTNVSDTFVYVLPAGTECEAHFDSQCAMPGNCLYVWAC